MIQKGDRSGVGLILRSLKVVTTCEIVMVFCEGGGLSEVTKNAKILKKANVWPLFGFVRVSWGF